MVFTRSKQGRNSCQKTEGFADEWLQIKDVWPNGQIVSEFHKGIILQIQAIVQNSNLHWKELAELPKLEKMKKRPCDQSADRYPKRQRLEETVSKRQKEPAVVPVVSVERIAPVVRPISEDKMCLKRKSEGGSLPMKRQRVQNSLPDEEEPTTLKPLTIRRRSEKVSTGVKNNYSYMLKETVIEFKERLRHLCEPRYQIEFRACQVKGFKALIRKLNAGYIGYYDMATGSGKSFMIYSLTNLFLNCKNFTQNVLIVTPRIALVEQLGREYKTFCQKAHQDPKLLIPISSLILPVKRFARWRAGSKVPQLACAAQKTSRTTLRF